MFVEHPKMREALAAREAALPGAAPVKLSEKQSDRIFVEMLWSDGHTSILPYATLLAGPLAT